MRYIENKTADPTISMIILNEDRLNTPIRKQRLSGRF